MSSFRTLLSKKIFIPILYKHWNVPVFPHYEELMSHESWSENKIRELQEQKLVAMLRYAFLNIPYYHKVLKQNGVSIDDIKDKTALYFFPVLTKKIIQENFDELVAPNIKDYATEHSGGSTGQPTMIRRELSARALVNAATWRANQWMGWEVGDPWMWLWGRLSTTKSSAYSKLLNLYKTFGCQEGFFNVHGLNKEKLLAFIRMMHWFKPKIITGYTNAYYFMCLLIKQEGLSVPKLFGVATTAETLYEEQRNVIEEVLGCKVFNRYASSEVGLIATECPAHNGLHITMENIYLECVKEDGTPLPAGTQGKLWITDLNNHAMPLIRYDLGDIGTFATAPCACGRPYPCVEKITGRISDILRLPNNRIVFPDDLAEILYPLPQVRKFQVIQEALTKVTVSLVLKAGTEDKALKELIYRQVREALGQETDITLNFVEDIPILPSGKHRICISKVSQL